MMDARRARRPQDADQLLAAIAALSAGQPLPRPADEGSTVDREAAPLAPVRSTNWTLLAAVLLLPLLGIALGLLLASSDDAVTLGDEQIGDGRESADAETAVPAWPDGRRLRWIGDASVTFAEFGAVRYGRAGRHLLLDDSMLVAENARIWNRALIAADDFTIALALQPWDLEQQGPARILASSLNHSVCNLVLGQSGSRLELRCHTSATNPDGTRPSLSTPTEILSGEWQHVVVRRQQGRHAIFVDGRAVIEREIPGALSSWKEDYPLAIGDEQRGGFPWRGSLDEIVVYTRALDDGEIAELHRAWLVEAP
jgi:hypothetical protein